MFHMIFVPFILALPARDARSPRQDCYPRIFPAKPIARILAWLASCGINAQSSLFSIVCAGMAVVGFRDLKKVRKRTKKRATATA
jgi:hypothetical protein